MNSEQEKITASKALNVKIPPRSKKILILSYVYLLIKCSCHLLIKLPELQTVVNTFGMQDRGFIYVILIYFLLKLIEEQLFLYFIYNSIDWLLSIIVERKRILNMIFSIKYNADN